MMTLDMYRIPAPFLMFPDGLKLFSDVPMDSKPVNIDVIPIFSDYPGRNLLGPEMMEYARRIKSIDLGERHARAFIAQEDQIPEKCRRLYCIFPGTKRIDPYDNIYVPYACLRGGSWQVIWKCINDGCGWGFVAGDIIECLAVKVKGPWIH